MFRDRRVVEALRSLDHLHVNETGVSCSGPVCILGSVIGHRHFRRLHDLSAAGHSGHVHAGGFPVGRSVHSPERYPAGHRQLGGNLW